MTHDLQRQKEQTNFHSLPFSRDIFIKIKVMSNYYPNNDNRLNEVRSIISQMNLDDLKKLMNDDEEVLKFIRNLPEVCSIEIIKTKHFFFLRFNKRKQLKKI